MTQHFTKRLVNLSGFGLAPQGNSELCLDHVERRLYVAALVVALHEFLGVVAIQVKHLFPEIALSSPMGVLIMYLLRPKSPTPLAVRLERNVGHRVIVYYRLQVLGRQIGLICANFLHCEVLSSCLNQSLELGRVSEIAVSDFNRRNDVRFYPAHDMAFDKTAFLNQMRVCVFGGHPLDKARSRKATTINREVRLNSLQ